MTNLKSVDESVTLNKNDLPAQTALQNIFGFDFKLVQFCLAVFILLYGYELSNFTLSIDEEFYSFASNNNFGGWVSQGRWGMALLGEMLPPIWSMPVISTSLFGVGLIFSSLHLAKTFNLNPSESVIFCGVWVASPIWPHIVEFSTLSYGVGVGLVSMAMGARLILKKGWPAFFSAALLWAFAVSIYQSFLFLGTLILCILPLFFGRHPQGEPVSLRKNINYVRNTTLFLLLTFGMYIAIQIGFNKIYKIEITHIFGFDYVGAYVNNFSYTLHHALGRSLDFLLGKGQIYLGWGKVIVILPFIGLVILCYAVITGNGNYKGKVFLGTLILSSLAITLAPFFVFAGEVNARMVIWLPFLFAIFSIFALNLGKFRGVTWALFVTSIFVCSYISNSLFYSDALVREQDRVLATNLIQSIESKLGARPDSERIKFAMIGMRRASAPVKEIEVFGASFFSWDQGNVQRANSYLNILGMTRLDPVLIANLSLEEVEGALAMPTWPHAGSVAWVGNLLVVKLSALTYEQKYQLCKNHKDWAYCKSDKL